MVASVNRDGVNDPIPTCRADGGAVISRRTLLRSSFRCADWSASKILQARLCFSYYHTISAVVLVVGEHHEIEPERGDCRHTTWCVLRRRLNRLRSPAPSWALACPA